MVHRYFLLYLPPRPLGTHPLRLPRYRGRATSDGGGELRYSIYLILELSLIHNPSERKISQATNHPLNNDKKKKNWMSSSFFRNFALF